MDDTTLPPTPTAPGSEDLAYQILDDLGLSEIPEDKKQEFLARTAQLIDQEVLYAVLSRLSDEDIDEWEQLLDDGEDQNPFDDKSYAFLAAKIPDLATVVQDALVTVYDELKETSDILSS